MGYSSASTATCGQQLLRVYDTSVACACCSQQRWHRVLAGGAKHACEWRANVEQVEQVTLASKHVPCVGKAPLHLHMLVCTY